MEKSTLTKNQKKKVIFNNVEYQGEKIDVIVELRYDDECGNGHNTFSITGSAYIAGKRGDRNMISCGCIHDIISEVAPEYKKYIPYHLMSSDGPMYYIANTLYHAGDKDCWGLRKGEVRRYDQSIKFGDFPITFKKDVAFIEWLQENKKTPLIIEAVEHKKDTDSWSSKYTFKGYNVEWHQCPFDTLIEAEQFKEALVNSIFTVVKIPTSWGQGKKPDLEAARSCAIAPDATLEQLQSREWLEARAPKLQQKFKELMEELGFKY